MRLSRASLNGIASRYLYQVLQLARCTLISLSMSTLLCYCSRAVAQSSTQEEPPLVRTTTRSVVVDVVVAGEKNSPAVGLQKQDFQVFEDGKPQVIDFFEEHADSGVPPSASPLLAAMPPHSYTNVPSEPRADSVNILLLDALNTAPQDYAYARNQVMTYLRHAATGQKMAIFILDRKLTLVQGFTDDASKLLDALNGREKATTSQSNTFLIGRDEVAGTQRTQEMVNIAAAGAVADAFVAFSEFKLQQRIEMTLEALDIISRYLANVPGRKNLLWFSGSFPIILFPDPGQQSRMAQSFVDASRVRKTVSLVNSARIALYPMSAQGVMTDSVLAASSPGPGNTPGVGHIGAGDSYAKQLRSPVQAYMSDANERAALIYAMNRLAQSTGGKAIYNTNDLEAAIRQALDYGGHYYTIAYTPSNTKPDRSFRVIEVTVKNEHYKLAYRTGYYPDEPVLHVVQAKADPLGPMLQFGLPNATQILFGVRVEPEMPQPHVHVQRAGQNHKLNGPTTRYRLSFLIRRSDLDLTSDKSGIHNGSILLGLIAYDRSGKAVNWEGVSEQVHITRNMYETAEHSGLPAQMDVDLPDGQTYLNVGVYDWTTGKTGTLSISLADGPGALGRHTTPSPTAP